MLMPIEPEPVAIAVAVAVVVPLVTVLAAVLVAADVTDMTVALVKVVNVVDEEPIVIPDIPPMSMPDISIFDRLLFF